MNNETNEQGLEAYYKNSKGFEYRKVYNEQGLLVHFRGVKNV